MTHCDLGSFSYGFINLPSLFLFVDPFAIDERARAFLFSGNTPWQEAQALAFTLEPEARIDFVTRYTAFTHEIAHFDDLLMTYYGNMLVHEYLKLGVMAISVCPRLIQWTRSRGMPIKLPIDPTDYDNDPDIVELMKQNERCKKLFGAGLYAMETSAIVQQHLGVADMFSADDLNTADNNLFGSDHNHYKLFALFDSHASFLHSFEDGWTAYTIIRAFLLSAMSTDEPDRYLAYILKLIDTADSDHSGDARHAAVSELREMLSSLPNILQTARVQSFEQHIKFLEFLDTQIVDAEITKVAKRAAMDFWIAAARAQEVLSGDVKGFLDPFTSPALKTLPSPYLYIFCSGSNPGCRSIERPQDLDPHDFFRFEEDNEKRDMIVLGVIPTDNSASDRHRLEKSVWVEVAKSFAGSLALVTGYNRRHPIMSPWFQFMKSGGVTFEDR